MRTRTDSTGTVTAFNAFAISIASMETSEFLIDDVALNIIRKDKNSRELALKFRYAEAEGNESHPLVETCGLAHPLIGRAGRSSLPELGYLFSCCSAGEHRMSKVRISAGLWSGRH